jgi:hypothetical protein
MKTEMRRALAREPYEQKINKVEQLIRLAKEFPRQRTSSASDIDDTTGAKEKVIISAIRNRNVLEFLYNGKMRTVEPQTYGLSTAAREVLRAYERTATNSLKRSGMAKLFDLEKISNLRKAGTVFAAALSAHNPNDSAMVEVFATLPKPKT